jgi:aspartate kinase
VGGFVGSTADGRTTTLGRGGSDTTAAVLGSCLGAEEIQIWTDVEGILSADPRLVERARTQPRVSFAEAAELAFYGAKVLHPLSIAPAVKRAIPVRVLSSLDPASPGTVILGESAAGAPALASVASRGGVLAVRATSRRMRMDAGFLPRVLAAFDVAGIVPDLVVSSEVAVTLCVAARSAIDRVASALGDDVRLETMEDRAIVCIVGNGLATDAALRSRVLSALAEVAPELVALGGSATSVAAVVPERGLKDAVRGLHRRFFEPEAAA